VSKGRRFILILGIALGVAGTVPLVLAQQTPTNPPTTPEGPADPLPDPGPSEKVAPIPGPEEDLLRIPPATALAPSEKAKGKPKGKAQPPKRSVPSGPAAKPAQPGAVVVPPSPAASSEPETTPEPTARPSSPSLPGTPAPGPAPAVPQTVTPTAEPETERPGTLDVSDLIGAKPVAPPLPSETTEPAHPEPLLPEETAPQVLGNRPAFPGRNTEPRRDDEALRVQTPGGAPPAAPGDSAALPASPDTSKFVLPADRLPHGRQALGLTVDVQAPAVVNLNQETKLKVVVRNTSANDAIDVVVRDLLPDELTYIDSQPPAESSPPVLTWKLGTLPANSERTLSIRVKATKVGSFDHAATVIMMAGGKSSTLVQEPKLKVEQSVKQAKVLKGGQAEFLIVVSNPGTGPVRNVVVQARLSRGLKHEQGGHIEQPIKVIKPGERVELDPVMVDATEGGNQTCEVTARSPDVPQETDEARAAQAVTVVEPKLDLTLKGPTTRFTDTSATYKLTVDNPGTAIAREIHVAATLPVGGVLMPEASDASFHRQYDRFKRKIIWTIPQLEPGAPVVLPFTVRLGGVQLFQVTGEAHAEGPIALSDRDTCSTNVQGMADVQFTIGELRRVVDEGEETEFEIRINNKGSKEANRVLVSAQLSKHLVPKETSGTDKNAKLNSTGTVLFPPIDRISPRGEVVLTIKVQAREPGIANCKVTLVHDDLENSALDRSAALRVTASGDAATR
jgi:uncharacterized repeat protein (TIGR01451 family)